MRAYFAQLNSLIAPPAAQQPSALECRFESWWTSLPQSTRQRPYSMQEIEQALHAQGRHVGVMLAAKGWVRKRKWQGTTHYWRYWLPPKA